MPTYEEVRERFEKEDRMEVFEQAIEDACQKIMRQTDYTRDTSFEKLKEHQLDIIEIVREWMGAPPKKEADRTANQMVFDEFRTFLDNAANKYYRKKEAEEARQAFIQRAAAEELKRRQTLKDEGRSKASTLETVEEVSDEQKSPINTDSDKDISPTHTEKQ